MHSLLGDRFLKWFLGNRLRQHRSTPASQAEIIWENKEGKTAGLDPVTGEKLLDKVAPPEMKNIGEQIEPLDL